MNLWYASFRFSYYDNPGLTQGSKYMTVTIDFVTETGSNMTLGFEHDCKIEE